MKKYIIRVFLLLALLVGIGTLECHAKIYTNDPTVNSGGTATITVSSQETVGAYTVNISSNNGVTLNGVSGPSGVNTEKIGSTGITGITSSGTNTLATYTFSVPTVTSDTKYTVTFTSSDMADTNLNPISGTTATATITVKAPVSNPSPSTQATPATNPSPAAPSFTSVNETVYATTEVNVRSSYSTSSSRIGSLQKGESVTRTGVGSNGWSRVTYNGQTGYINSSYLTKTKPDITTEPSAQPSTSPDEKSSDATLKSLSIAGVELTPTFDSAVTYYTANVGADITDVEILAQTNSDKATYEVTGNTALQDGENIAVVIVTAEDGTVEYYEINIIKGDYGIPLDALAFAVINENDEKTNITLPKISIVDGVAEYTINLSEYMKSIEIIATLDEALNQYEGIGTFDLVAGENKFTVTLKMPQEDAEEKTVEYRITVNNPEKVVAEENDETNYMLIAIIGAIVVVTILVITLLVGHYRKQHKIEYAEPDYSFLKNDEEIQNKEQKRDEEREQQKEQAKEEEKQEENSDTPNDDNDDGEKRKGGKHF